MGSVGENYSVQRETAKLLEEGILNNRRIPDLPPEIKDAVKLVKFTGNDQPSIPINWRFAESVSALKAFEASMLNVLRARKFGAEFSEVNINTDHASLFVMSPFLGKMVKANGETIEFNIFNPKAMKEFGFKDTDLHRVAGSLHRGQITNIFRTKDGRFYHVHGKMQTLRR